MRRTLIFFTAFLLVILPVSAWNSATHMKFVENMFYQLAASPSLILDLDALRNGSVAPDLVFHDTRRHHYPPSFAEATFWLNETFHHLEGGNITAASYAFGVASHYITDTHAAPHHIQKEPSSLHSLYERQGNQDYFFVNCSSLPSRITSEEDFLRGVEQNKTWNSWLVTRDPFVPQRAVREAAIIILQTGKEMFHASCKNSTEIQEVTEEDTISFTFSWKMLVILFLLFLTIKFFCDLL